MARLSTRLRDHDLPDRKRRELLLRGLSLSGMIAAGLAPLAGCRSSSNGSDTADAAAGAAGNLGDIGPLQAPDENLVALPKGFTSRIVARTGEQVANSGYTWHIDPDGGAVFPSGDGGWIYVSNSEETPGGVGAIRFDRDANIVNAYSICDGTRNNCAGGPTPWGTWMTCEETTGGKVYECDPFGLNAPVELPAMGRYQHEAVAIDPDRQMAYLTEDRGDGGFYRTIPEFYPDFRTGTLQIAEIVEDDLPGPSPVRWNDVPDPAGGTIDFFVPITERNPTRQQAGHTPFDGGEGIWYFEGIIYFSTKGDSVIWAYNTEAETIEKVYDLQSLELAEGDSCGPLCQPDNVTVSSSGDVIVAEDAGLLRLVVITPERKVATLLQIDHPGSELAGPAFSPDGSRLYFSSQRGPNDEGGVTFEISGPFTG